MESLKFCRGMSKLFVESKKRYFHFLNCFSTQLVDYRRELVLLDCLKTSYGFFQIRVVNTTVY